LTARALLRELWERGATIHAAGDRVKVIAPAASLPPELLDVLRAKRDELLAELRDAGGYGAPDLRGSVVTDVREEVAAVRLRSGFGDVWIVRDEDVAGDLAAEEPGFPILTFAEVPQLGGKSREMLRALLDAKAVCPTAWVLQ